MSQWPSGGSVGLYNLAATQAKATIDVTIVSPADGATNNAASLPVTWSFAPGTQASFRVRIYDDTGLILIYDSGILPGTAVSHTVPEGALSTATDYTVRVDIETTLGKAGFNVTMPTVTMAFATGADIVGLVLTQVTSGLPHVDLDWTQIVPAGGEAFQRYNVYRRRTGDTLWTRIATIAAITTVDYSDYRVGLYGSYDYAVTYSATQGAQTLESSKVTAGSNGSISLLAKGLWIHAADDVTVYGAFPASSLNITRKQDIEYLRARGRTKPTAFISEEETHEISLELLPTTLDDVAMWDMLKTLQTRQRVQGSVLCVRWFHAAREVYFVQFDQIERQDDQNMFKHSLPLTEVHFDEAV